MTTEEKNIYAIGEVPPLGFVPKKMHAWVIRKDRHGNPMQSFQAEEFDVPANSAPKPRTCKPTYGPAKLLESAFATLLTLINTNVQAAHSIFFILFMYLSRKKFPPYLRINRDIL